MKHPLKYRPGTRHGVAVTLVAGAIAAMASLSVEARVTKIVIDSTTPLTGQTLTYQTIRGRAFGTLDPADAHNAVITDIQLAKDTDGLVHYETTFTLTMPTDMSKASGFLWHDVPNRGGSIIIVPTERQLGDVGLTSGWQADNAGATAIPANHATGSNHWVQVPIARINGQEVTGNVLGRIVNRSGVASQPLLVGGNPVPYLPANLDTTQAVLTTHTHETSNGVVSIGSVIPSSEWSYAHCDPNTPFPGTPDDISEADLPGNLPVHICLKNGYDPTLLYQLVYPAKNAYVLGVGIAAFRDVGSFFKYSAADDSGTANPIASRITGSSMRGVSQSGNFTRQFIYMGMNQDESNRKLHDGAWPQIAGRRVAANVRWGQPDGVLELYQMGSEGPQWWSDFPDVARGLPTKGIFTRCNLNGTCPKVIEHFGGSEVFALKMTMSWVGTSANTDIPLARNVRRYYVASTTHGGGAGGFNWQPASPNGAGCPGNNYGTGLYPANPMPSSQMINVIRLAMRQWVMNNVLPPPSRYPTLIGGTLVDPTKAAMGFPSGVPGVSDAYFQPENFIFPAFDYNWGPNFNESDASGTPSLLPPPIDKVIPMKVPRVDADGNELGGIPNTLRDAPLGTYLGWNITAAGFHKGQVCNYVGGYIPFALTKAQRLATGDTRLSLQERYGTHAGYVAKVKAAADSALSQGYLTQDDHDLLIQQAQASSVLN